MRSPMDRIRQAVSFEIIGLVSVTPLFAWLFARPVGEIGFVALAGASVATVWNYLFNLGFDHFLQWWRGDTRKTPLFRIVHAILFEATLLVLLLPFFAWWLGISLLAALMMDLSFAAFYVGYTFLFTWGYDRVFPPPSPERARG